jgi:hypothetical protein
MEMAVKARENEVSRCDELGSKQKLENHAKLESIAKVKTLMRSKHRELTETSHVEVEDSSKSAMFFRYRQNSLTFHSTLNPCYLTF